MEMNVNNYNQFYKGTQQLKKYGSASTGGKDTLEKYAFHAKDAAGNKVTNRMSREETMEVMKEVSSQYGDHVIVEFSGDGMAKLLESRKGCLDGPLSEEEEAAKSAKQAEFEGQTVQLEKTHKKAEGSTGTADNDFHTILKENDPALAEQVEGMNQKIVNHQPGDPSNAKTFYTLMKKAMQTVNGAVEETAVVSGKQREAGPQLSGKAQTLLEKLRKDYSGMDFFVLGAGDDARALLAGGTKEISVVFTVDELEKMAVDEAYAQERMNGVKGAIRMSEEINKKFGYEPAFCRDTDKGAATKLGISVGGDGTITYFAQLEKSSKQQRER